MAAMHTNSVDSNIAEMNITPLIDVMLVLLVIFMIAAPIFTQPIPLPLGRTDGPPVKVEPIELRIDAAGDVFFNGAPVPRTALHAMFQAEAQRDPQRIPTLKIQPNADVEYQVVAKVLATAQNAGLHKISIAR